MAAIYENKAAEHRRIAEEKAAERRAVAQVPGGAGDEDGRPA